MQYCYNCGEKLPPINAKFCPHCGSNLQINPAIPSDSVTQNSSSEVQLLVYSHFKPLYHFMVNVFSASSIFFSVVLGGFFGSMVMDYLADNPYPDDYTVDYLPDWIHGNAVGYTTFGVLVFAIVWVISPILNTLVKKLTYAKTVYRIYRDRIEYREGFMNENYSKIDFEKVIEIHLRKGFIQKRVKLGTVFVEIPGSGKGRNGINLCDLPNYEEVYTLLKRLVNEHQIRVRQ